MEAFHKDVDDQVRKNSDAPLDADRNATQYVTQILMNRLEIQWVTDYFATSIWTTDSTPGTLWDDVTSDPIGDIETGKATVLSSTGFEPNTLVLGYDVFRQLKIHPDLVDCIKYTSAETITPDLLARLLDVERVLVAKAVKNTSNENATASYAFTHGKHALLCYAAPSPGIEVPSAGYNFEWTGISEGLGAAAGIKRIPMPWLGNNTTRIEGQMAWDNKVISADLGYFFSSAVS